MHKTTTLLLYNNILLLKKLTTTEDRECPKLEKTVPIQSVRTILRMRRSQQYFQSLDMINNDLQVKTATLVAVLAFPLVLRSGPSCRSNCIWQVNEKFKEINNHHMPFYIAICEQITVGLYVIRFMATGLNYYILCNCSNMDARHAITLPN